MNIVFHLAKCSSCQNILKEVQWPYAMQDIRSQKISTEQIEYMASLAGSYQALFSKRAIKYKSMGLKHKTLSEADYKTLILEEDTFLKRPVFIVDESIFIGNSKKTLEQLKIKLGE